MTQLAKTLYLCIMKYFTSQNFRTISYNHFQKLSGEETHICIHLQIQQRNHAG